MFLNHVEATLHKSLILKIFKDCSLKIGNKTLSFPWVEALVFVFCFRYQTIDKLLHKCLSLTWRFCVVFCFFPSLPQRPMTSDFKGFSNPDFIHYIYFPILILQKEPVFPFLMFSAKQGHYWYHFYNVFGMTRSLTGDWTRDLPHSKPALYH